MKTLILTLHGFGGRSDKSFVSTYIDELFGADEDIKVVGIDYDSYNAPSSLREMNLAVERLNFCEPERVIIAAASLGAFWANYIASKYPAVELILLNPSVHAEVNTVKYYGENIDRYTGETKWYSSADTDVLASVKVETAPDVPTTVFTALDDDVVSTADVVAFYPAATMHVLEEGGHTLHGVKDALRDALVAAVY